MTNNNDEFLSQNFNLCQNFNFLIQNLASTDCCLILFKVFLCKALCMKYAINKLCFAPLKGLDGVTGGSAQTDMAGIIFEILSNILNKSTMSDCKSSIGV